MLKRYYALPEKHWRRIRTNSPLERLLREIRRRTRVWSGHSPTANLPLKHLYELLPWLWRPQNAMAEAG